MDNPEYMEPVEEQQEEQQEEVEVEEPTEEVDSSEASEDDAEELEEVEFDGKIYKVNRALKDSLLRQSDYTRKTQELAEARKAFEAEREQAFTQAQEDAKQQAKIYAIDEQLEQYKRLDWGQIIENEPIEAMKLQQHRQALIDQRAAMQGELEQARNARNHEKQAAQQKKIQEGYQKIVEAIPDWGQERIAALTKYAQSQGYSQQEIQSFDYRQVIALDKAERFSQLQKKTTGTQNKAKLPEPPKKVGGKARAKVDPDKLSIDDWMKYEAKRKGRG